jgi:uncharacterized protein (TIGR03382 family)
MMKWLKMAVLAGLLTAANAQAAQVVYTFSGTVDSGLLASTGYSGGFSYDDGSLTDSGVESVALSTLSFQFMGGNFGLGDADFSPTADFLNGIFLGLSYVVSGVDPGFSFISASGSGLLGDVAYLSYSSSTGDSGYGSLTYVPAPATAVLVLLGAGMLRRRR